MATFRPAVKEDDGYIQKIIKYIPAEIMTGYTVLVGFLTINVSTDIPTYKIYYIVLLCILAVITPVWTFYAVLDNDNPSVLEKNRKRAFFHSIIATLAFAIWVYSIGNPLLKAVLCGCQTVECQDCIKYSPILGSIILVLFTIMTPLIERIILGTKLPTK